MPPDKQARVTDVKREVSPDASATGWRIAAIAFLGGIGGGIVFPILPVLGTKLEISGLVIGLILSMNRVVRIGVNPFTGTLVDRFGGKWPLTAGLGIEALATLGYSMALHSDTPALWFIGARALWGVGSSFLMVGALAAVLVLSESRDRGRLTARVRMSLSMGLPAGLAVGGLVADFFSDNVAFLSAAGLSVLGAVLAFWTVPGRTEPGSGSRPWSSARRDWKILLAQPALRAVWTYNLLVFFAIQGVLLATLVIFIDRRGLIFPGFGSQGSAGVLMAFLMLWRATAALAIGRWLDRSGRRRTRLLLPAVGLLILGFTVLGLAHNFWWTGAGLLCLGAGTGAVTIPLLALLGDLASERRRGRALSIYQVFGDTGGSIGPILGLEVGESIGFLVFYLGLAALFALTGPLAFWLQRYERGNAARR